MINALKKEQYDIVMKELTKALQTNEKKLKTLEAELVKANLLTTYLEKLSNVYYLEHRSVDEITSDIKNISFEVVKIELSISHWKQNEFYITTDLD